MVTFVSKERSRAVIRSLITISNFFKHYRLKASREADKIADEMSTKLEVAENELNRLLKEKEILKVRYQGDVNERALLKVTAKVFHIHVRFHSIVSIIEWNQSSYTLSTTSSFLLHVWSCLFQNFAVMYTLQSC